MNYATQERAGSPLPGDWVMRGTYTRWYDRLFFGKETITRWFARDNTSNYYHNSGRIKLTRKRLANPQDRLRRLDYAPSSVEEFKFLHEPAGYFYGRLEKDYEERHLLELLAYFHERQQSVPAVGSSNYTKHLYDLHAAAINHIGKMLDRYYRTPEEMA